MRTLLYFIIILSASSLSAQWQEHIVTDQAISPKKVIAADIDGDGWIDIVSMNFQQIEWYKNLGDGTFAEGIVVGELIDGRDIAVGDIDGDGDLDIISVRAGFYLPYNMFLHENIDGNGTFAEPLGIATPYTEGGLKVMIVDIDANGVNDILTTTNLDRKLTWYKNLGNRTFDEGTVISAGYISGFSLDIGDIDGDGEIDIVVNTPNYRKTSWFQNLDGEGNFGPPIEIGSRNLNLQSLFLMDIDGDGDLDLIGSGSVGSEEIFSWWENLDGQGNFSLQERVIDTELTTYIFPVDLDNDGDLDVLTLAPGYLKWYENLDGSGNFSGPTIIKDDLPFAITVTAADLLNNGNMNPITASQRLNTIYWFEPQNIGTPDFTTETITIYPNPTQDILHIQTPTGFTAAILYDVTQREIKRYPGNQTEINLAGLQTGFYFLHINTSHGTIIRKIMKK